MSGPKQQTAAPADPRLVLDLIDSIQVDLERLRGLVQPRIAEFDPSDPRNKSADGKLTPHGVECCYRMFDEGKSRYSVAQAMKISFAAATHRFATWTRAGGSKRKRQASVRLG